MNLDEWLETLSMHADITLVDQDFDLDQVCADVKPDFIIYESPFFYVTPLRITNPRAHPHIPRFALMNQDVYCSIRVHMLRVMESLGVSCIFTHMTETALNQSPEWKHLIISMPLLFDDRIFYDYQLQKDIPVSVFGGFMHGEIYNWRVATAHKIPEHFPTLIYTHPGGKKPIPRHLFPVSGETYAQMLNRSHFSIADTTHVGCVVRKHLEIPAAGSVLVAPNSSVLKPYGFVDMENCILGEGEALFDKIAAVADDPDLYEKIRSSGHKLVHGRYTRRDWHVILNYYECWRTLKPGETIRQIGILGDFTAMPTGNPLQQAVIDTYDDNSISATLRQWLNCILEEDGLSERNKERLRIPEWLHHVNEPLVLMGLMCLLRGELTKAYQLFLAPQETRLGQSGYTDYDPEEIAWLSLIAALTGDAKLLAMTRKESAAMRHLSLRRMQWLGNVLASGGDATNQPVDVLHRKPDDQISIHWTGQIEIKDWLSLVSRILATNGQAGILRT